MAAMHFAILIYDEPDSAALRDQYRQSHLDYLKVFDDQPMSMQMVLLLML